MDQQIVIFLAIAMNLKKNLNTELCLWIHLQTYYITEGRCILDILFYN